MYRFLPLAASLLMFALFAACVPVSPFFWIGVLMFGGLSALGLYDVLQREHTLWRNYPIAGRIRWIAEELRPFLRIRKEGQRRHQWRASPESEG